MRPKEIGTDTNTTFLILSPLCARMPNIVNVKPPWALGLTSLCTAEC
jgi:hypothetical protein